MKRNDVMLNLIEVIENQPDERLAQIEVESITEGYSHYLFKEGYTLQGATLELMRLFTEVMEMVNSKGSVS